LIVFGKVGGFFGDVVGFVQDFGFVAWIGFVYGDGDLEVPFDGGGEAGTSATETDSGGATSMRTMRTKSFFMGASVGVDKGRG